MLIFCSMLCRAEGMMVNIPYLQNPTNNGITVTWITSVPAFSYLEYGKDKDNLERITTVVDGQIVSGNLVNNIRIEGLEFGVKYYYRVTSKEIIQNGAYTKVFGKTDVSEFYSFKIPSKKADYKTLVLNDLHKQKKTVDQIAKYCESIDYDLIIFNGDCIDDPNNRNEAIDFVSYLSDKLGKGSIPFVFVRGNHEIRGAYSVFLREIIEYSTERSFGGFMWGDTRYVILDCGEDKPDDHPAYYGLNDFEQFRIDQVDFLKEELRSKEFKKAKHRVLIHHIPIYKDSDYYNPCYELWHPMLKNANFAFSLCAHTHAHAFYDKGLSTGNNFPVFIGGGYNVDDATVIILEKEGDKLISRMYDLQGNLLAEHVDK